MSINQQLLRLKQILGDPASVPPKPALIPVSRATWWRGVREGRYPQPVRISQRCVAWRSSEIRALLDGGRDESL